ASVMEYTISPGEKHYGEMTTVIDRVYDYINKKEITSTKELSERLGIKQKQVERMVEMLETSQLIKLRYSVVPTNGNIEILAASRSYDPKKEITHEERIKKLKKVIVRDVEKLEGAVASMEHHLNMWSSEAEEKMTKGTFDEQSAKQVVNEASRMERTLDHVRTETTARLATISKRVAEMRGRVNKGENKPKPDKPSGVGGGLFRIKNPFNF
ncbi:MAG: hypothetical protein ABIF01_05590, partial [Candidatus Micrarchaeota archaeon]